MKQICGLYTALFCLLISPVITAQKPPINFHHLTVSQGLNDGMVNGICRDKYGYMWFATLGGLNRFDGTTATRYTPVPGDSTSLKNAVPYALASGHDDRLWVGYTDGLLSFSIFTGKCRSIKELAGVNIYEIRRAANNKLYMATSRGPVCYNPETGKEELLYAPADTVTQQLLSRQRPGNLFCKGNIVFFGVYNGIVKYDMITKKATRIDLTFLNAMVNRVIEDSEGYLWVSNYSRFRLLRLSADGKKIEPMDWLLVSPDDKRLAAALDMAADKQGRVWIITGVKGLIEYSITAKKVLYHQHDSQLKSSLSSDILRTMYLSDDGTVWVASFSEVDYFHPDKNLFTIIYPFDEVRESKYARGVVEDHRGHFWFTTGNGISQFNPQTGAYRVWRNEAGKKNVIYYNSVRGVAEDSDKRIWIATGAGVNRLDPASGKMEFLTIKDSLPQAFYFSINKLKDGTIWFGTRDYDGFYFWSPSDRKVHSISSVPALKSFAGKGGRYVLEDSKKRLWFGFNGNGLGMYDPVSGKTRHWINKAGADQANSIAGNLIIDIKEDKKGVIWVSTFGGVTGIDTGRELYYNYTDKNGLKSNIAGPIAIDELNRLWIGTAAGLAMLDSSRKSFSYFGEESGLNVAEFPEHPGIYASDKDIIFPSVRGYIRFNPLLYKEAKPVVNFYISSFSLFNKQFSFTTDTSKARGIRLRPDENFFSIDLVALNYESPSKTWYAYQLEGFDKDWHFTQNPRAVYTNVPGGTYTFRYKATANVNDWNVPQKELTIHIATIFYKAVWFWTLAGVLIIGLLTWFYRNRIRHEQQVHLLQSKAQALEKEKALVMYENLKQHLNPHFLFNSLTSLSSLIRIDQAQAGNFLDKMSKVYRYILKNRDNEVVPLGEELKFVRLYIDLQQTRFEEGLQVKVTVDEEFHHRKIAPVTLQNLVENAIKHNTSEPGAPLRIELFVDNDYLVVRNNLQKKNFVETSNKQGLSNMESLYRYLGSRPMVIFEDEKYFTVKIPLL